NNKHFIEGEIFIYNNTEFVIIAMEPKDGYVTNNTKFHLEGDTIHDILELHINPILETLPDHHKNINNINDLKEFYLNDYFNGSFRYIDLNIIDKFTINNVQFYIQSSKPNIG